MTVEGRLHEARARIAELEAAQALLAEEADARLKTAIDTIERARAEERERCAQIADQWEEHPACSALEGYAGHMIAAAIREDSDG